MKLVRWGVAALKALLAFQLATIIVMVFGNVVLRYGFNSGLDVSEELSRWCLVWITFLGAALALKDGHHLGMDAMVVKLGRTGRSVCFALTRSTMLVVSAMFLVGSWRQTLLDRDVAAPVTGLSTAWFYGVGVVFSFLCILILGNDLLRLVRGKLTDAELIGIVESQEAL